MRLRRCACTLNILHQRRHPESNQRPREGDLVALKTFTPWIGGRYLPCDGRSLEQVTSPWDGEPLAELAVGTAADLEAAVGAAVQAFRELRAWPRHRRHDLLDRVSRALAADREDLA